jgi:hypothetical protein
MVPRAGIPGGLSGTAPALPQHVTDAPQRTGPPGKERIMFELWAAILAIGFLGLEYIAVRAYYHQHATEGH